MAEQPQGCARVTGTVQEVKQPSELPEKPIEKEMTMTARVGQKGAFTSVKLSDYLGKWVLLCFYPGDFTFV
jgi:peroxiredoxin (alkyl hydroperoxide reductase subunit C)